MPNSSKRDPILEGGLGLVHRAGFANSGVAAITAAGGAPKGSFYNHFPSKEAFGVAVLDRYFETVRSALAETLTGHGRSPLAGVRAYFELLRELGRRDSFAAGCLIGNLSGEASPGNDMIRARLASLLMEWAGIVAAAISNAQRIREVRDDVPAPVLASTLIDGWQGRVAPGEG